MFAAGMPGVGLSDHSAAVGVSNSAKLIHAAGAAAGPHSAHQLGRGGSSAASSWLPHTGNAVMASVTSGNFPSGEAGMLFKQAGRGHCHFVCGSDSGVDRLQPCRSSVCCNLSCTGPSMLPPRSRLQHHRQ